jgi:hypothetical protein
MLEGKVTRVRQLLLDAAATTAPRSTTWLRSGPIGTVRRKGLISDARLLAGRYSLQEHLLAFVYAAGCEAITGLDIDQLEQLVAKLARMGAALDAACDSPAAPPAR